MSGKIRVLIVDDHAILREGVRALLAMNADMEVVGEASDGQEALARVEALDPDVVLMDIAMPGLGGIEAALELRKRGARARISSDRCEAAQRRRRKVVEMGESRTPRPKPVTRDHYERVRCLISTDPPPSAGAMIGPAACP